MSAAVAAHVWPPWRQDQYERVLLNLYVKPDRPVVSYLTPLTGCDSSDACSGPELHCVYCLCSKHQLHFMSCFAMHVLAYVAAHGAALSRPVQKLLRYSLPAPAAYV